MNLVIKTASTVIDISSVATVQQFWCTPKTFEESTKGHVLLMIKLLIVEHGAQNCLLIVKSTLRLLVSSG